MCVCVCVCVFGVCVCVWCMCVCVCVSVWCMCVYPSSLTSLILLTFQGYLGQTTDIGTNTAELVKRSESMLSYLTCCKRQNIELKYRHVRIILKCCLVHVWTFFAKVKRPLVYDLNFKFQIVFCASLMCNT